MKLKNIILTVIALSFVATACSDFLTDDQQYTKEGVVTTSGLRSRGLIDDLYTFYDYEYFTDFSNEYLTDNAVLNSSETVVASGYWGPTSNPYSGTWAQSYDNMRQIYQYIDLIHDEGLNYTNDLASTEINAIVLRRYYGEAFFLKAWAEWELLKIFGGPDAAGNMLGFPIVNEILEDEAYASLTRDSYDDCVTQIMSDLDIAIDSLPLKYSSTSSFNPGLDVSHTGRASGLAAYALKAKVALFAASPAFNPTINITKWEAAAAYAHEAIVQNNAFLKNLQAYDYTSTTNADHFWRLRNTQLVNDLEKRLYPPSLYGQGEVNPSQNLVDAFPDSKGYPISLSTEYDANNPYASRDERFYKFIFYNGDQSYIAATGSDFDSLQIYEGGRDYWGGFMPNEGTRTGYYLKRFLNKLNFDPSAITATKTLARVYVQLGLTELYLSYAEAANEISGPNVAPPGLSFTAKEVLALVRKRAGITSDDYLDLMSANKDDFRTLLKNERRLEMCFTGERFHDLRRWNEVVATEDVKGMKVTKNDDGSFTYNEIDVEVRNYEAKNSYLPLPYDEVIKNSNLKQNKGWE